ncbi:hypothetical protein [Yersinia intermedia]|uniref:hypothetical protein n=1 Tax=Yersinia TaxID=629 RepID=UPI0005197AA1|nr:hypothetical protein [Yersinia intermedia]MDA5491910.1 hypothetical protein [Yersinia intermedia]QGR68158.1 hypothetical protein FOC38_20865 [Yersinia intermedia]
MYIYLSKSKESYSHGFKHYPPKNMKWDDIVNSTKSGPAKFKQGVNIPEVDQEVWLTGISVTNGQSWKVKEFRDVQGAYKGKETCWVVTKESGGVIHSHPIGEAESRRLIK